MENNLRFNLLRELDCDDYHSLISQVNLAKNGYDLYYAIDPELIHNYCYPLGIIPEEMGKQRKSKLTQDYLADEQITLHNLFYLLDINKRLLLLNEYCFELEGMLYVASRTEAHELDDFDVKLKTFEKGDGDDALMELLYESYSEMYAKVLLYIDGLKKASNILQNRRLILDSNNLENEVVKKIVNSNFGTEKDKKIIEGNMQYELQLGAKKKKRKQVLFPSKLRDVIAIGRILSFNRHIQKLKSNDAKKIFILLSDSSLVKNTMNRIRKEENRIEYPNLNDKQNIYFRNVAQSFAYLISLEYKNNDGGEIDFDKTITNLNNLREASQSLNERFNETSTGLDLNTSELLKKDVFTNYNRIRNAFENSGLLKSFDPLLKSIKNNLRGKKISDVAIIFKEFKEEEKKYIKDTIVDQHIYFLRALRKTGEFNASFLYGIESIKNEGATFDLSKGSDYIEGSHQHLPLLLTFSTSENGFIDHMYELIKLVLSHKSEDSILICTKLEKFFNEMNSSRIYDDNKSEINLIKALIFMILPSLRSIHDVKENDLLANNWLKELSIIESNEEGLKNKTYLNIWSSRRIREYQESIKIAEQAIIDFPNDPRFYHGLFLSQFCLCSDNKDYYLLDNMMTNLKEAHNRYYQFIEEKYPNRKLGQLIYHAMTDSFNNSYSYCLSLKAQLLEGQEKNEEYSTLMKEARKLINLLKDENGCYRDELPEYYDTEAYIEYSESFYLPVDKRIPKLEYAKTAIYKAIQLSKNEVLTKKYKSLLDRINQRIMELVSE